MRHFFLFITLLLIGNFNGCRQQSRTFEEEKPFKIVAVINDVTIDTVFFRYYRCVEENSVFDTISLTNGTFIIEGMISPRTKAYLSIKDKEEVIFYLDPGEMQLYLKKDSLKNFVLKGSQTQLDKEELENQTKTLEDYLFMIDTQLASEQSDQKKDFLINQKDSIVNLIENIRIDFIASNPTSHYSLDAIFLLLYNKMQNADVLISLFEGLSESVRESCSGKQIYDFILKRKISTMSNVSSLEALDKDGSLVKLSDFEGKYILIDFWASWCVPCIKGFPHLKELYAKYKDKGLVVISISADREEDERKWLNAIEKNNITEWIHILSCKNKGENNICDLDRAGLGSPIPHYILIDKSGNIIKNWWGFNDAVAKEQDDMLEDIFENKE